MNPLIIKIIWAALTLSQLLYGALLFTQPSGLAQSTPLPLWPAALGCALVSLFIFTTRLSYLSLQTMFRQNATEAAQRAFVFYVICWAMNESVALFGFVNAFVATHRFADFAPYLAAGVVLNFFMFPKIDTHLKEAEARKAAGQ